MLHNFGYGNHFCHGVTHRTKCDILYLGLLKLLKDVADIRLDLGARVYSNNIIGNLFAFNCGLDHLFVFLHDDLN